MQTDFLLPFFAFPFCHFSRFFPFSPFLVRFNPHVCEIGAVLSHRNSSWEGCTGALYSCPLSRPVCLPLPCRQVLPVQTVVLLTTGHHPAAAHFCFTLAGISSPARNLPILPSPLLTSEPSLPVINTLASWPHKLSVDTLGPEPDPPPTAPAAASSLRLQPQLCGRQFPFPCSLPLHFGQDPSASCPKAPCPLLPGAACLPAPCSLLLAL